MKTYHKVKCPYCGGSGEVVRAEHEPDYSYFDISQMKLRHEKGDTLRKIGKDYGLLAGSVKYYIQKYGAIALIRQSEGMTTNQPELVREIK